MQGLSLFDKADKRQAIGLVVMLFMGSLLEALGIGLLLPLINFLINADGVIAGRFSEWVYSAFSLRSYQQFIAVVFLMFVAVVLIKNTYLALLSLVQNKCIFNMQAKLARNLFEKYIRQPYELSLMRNSAQLINNLTAEIDAVVGHVIQPGITLVGESFVVVALLSLLLVTNPIPAVAILLTLMSGGALLYYLVRTKINAWGKLRQLHEQARQLYMQQGIAGIKDFKLLGREDYIVNAFVQENNGRARYLSLQFFINSLPVIWFELLVALSLFVLLVAMLSHGSAVTDILPAIGVFAGVAFRLIPSANRILVALQNLRYSRSAIEVLVKEISDFESCALKQDAVGLDNGTLAFNEVIDFKNVSYVYPGADRPALRNVSFRIRKGETIGIVGASGAGKSTLVDILLGLIEPTAGDVQVDGCEISGRVLNWQKLIGYVPQSIYLSDDTLRRNVAFALDEADIDDGKVLNAIAVAQLNRFLSETTDGTNLRVGERGSRLSGGQKQRIGIARALYRDPPILILDEATSALDVETESMVMDAIRNLHGKKTIVIIAHRLSTVDDCDRWLRVESGRIEEISKSELDSLTLQNKVEPGGSKSGVYKKEKDNQ